MENENEPLDWGNEEEEQQQAHRRASQNYPAHQEVDVDADEAGEDAISLGDEDEDGYYFQREDAQRHELTPRDADEPFEKSQSPRRRDDSSGANEQQRKEQPRYHTDRGRYERSPPLRSAIVQPDSPPRERERPSRPQTSPGQVVTTRLKHALPPKPATAKVPYLPPSHPSIVAATSMTEMPSRDTPHDAKLNGASSGKAAASATPLPHPWELRVPRGGGQPYFFNPETHASTWTHPVSNVSIYSPPQYRHHAGSRSPSEAYVKSSDPNMHQARGHTSRPHLNSDVSRGRSDRDIDNDTRSDEEGQYRDRHYRPPGDPASATAPVVHEARPALRSDAMSSRYSSRPRYDRSPPPASPRQRRHARSISPSDTRTPVNPRNQEYPPSRGSHLVPRDKHDYTNPTPVQRDTDITPRDRWASSRPPAEYERSDRVPHKPPHRPGNADERGFGQFPQDEPRPHIPRRESSRGPPRDRDPSRRLDAHEYPSGNSGFISAPRHYPRERDNGRDYPPFREPTSTPGQPNADRKDRPPPFDRSASSNAPPPNMGPPDHKQFDSRTSDREQFNPRASDRDQFNPRTSDRDQFNPRASDREQYNPRSRQYDARPSSAYDQRRVGERDYERSRREGPPDDHQPRSHPNEYPPRDVPPTANSSRPSRYPDVYDRTMPEDPSQRRRQPLPPQTATYATAPAPAQRSPTTLIKQPGWANFDSSLPRRPKFEVNNAAMHAKEKAERLEREKAQKQQAEAGGPSPVPVERPAPPATEPDRRNGAPGLQTKAPEQREQYTQRPPRLDTRMDIVPTDTRRAPSPRGMRSGSVLQDEGGQQYPGGPRSARTPTERAPYSALAAAAPPPNPRFENGFQGLPPPPRDAGHLDERRFHELRAENRPDWRNNRSANERPANDRLGNDRVVNDRPGNGYPERGPMPPRRDFRGRPDEIDTSNGSGPNNLPIGNRRETNAAPGRPVSYPPNNAYFPRPPPQAFGFNPDARPPPSALIRPAAASDSRHVQEPYTRSSKPPATEEHHRNVPPIATQFSGPQSAANQQAALSAEGGGPRRRVSRFSPLIAKPDPNQEHAPRGSPEEPHQRGRAATPPPVSRDSSTLSDQKSGRYIDSLERAQMDMRARAALRDRGARNAADAAAAAAAAAATSAATATATAATADRIGSSQTASTLSTESASSQPQRPRYRWSEQMANAAAPDSPEAPAAEPDLSRRLSSEKPPRHRKYSVQRFTADDIMSVDAPPSDEPMNTSPENTVNFLDRLDAPILSRRSSKLLDRLSAAQDSPAVSADAPESSTPSLRDRLVPSKRNVDDMMDVETGSYDGDDNENKRLKRRTSKAKRGGRR